MYKALQPIIIKWMVSTLCCMLCTTQVLAQKSSADEGLLFWSKDHRLTLQDFHGRAPAPDTIYIRRNRSSNLHRLGVIRTAIDVQVNNIPGKTIFTIRALMDQKGSWISSAGDTISLKHEQGHFDICEIYTREMRKAFSKAVSVAQSKVLYEAILSAESAEHAAYDRDNTFEAGGITPAWASRIARRLGQLAVYANPVVVIAAGKSSAGRR